MKMLAYCLGLRDDTDDNFLLTMRFLEIEIKKKNLDRKTKMIAYCSGHRVGTADTIISPVRPLEIEISKKIILD